TLSWRYHRDHQAGWSSSRRRTVSHRQPRFSPTSQSKPRAYPRSEIRRQTTASAPAPPISRQSQLQGEASRQRGLADTAQAPHHNALAGSESILDLLKVVFTADEDARYRRRQIRDGGPGKGTGPPAGPPGNGTGVDGIR